MKTITVPINLSEVYHQSGTPSPFSFKAKALVGSTLIATGLPVYVADAVDGMLNASVEVDDGNPSITVRTAAYDGGGAEIPGSAFEQNYDLTTVGTPAFPA